MSECELHQIRTGPWILSGRDHVLLERIMGDLWNWVPWLREAKDLIAFGHVMKTLEDIHSLGAEVPERATVELHHKPEGQGGLGVVLHLGPEQLELGRTEWVWMPDRRHHDHGTGLPICLETRGSWDEEAVGSWLDDAYCVHRSIVDREGAGDREIHIDMTDWPHAWPG